MSQQMASFRGERFNIDLSDNEHTQDSPSDTRQPLSSDASPAFVKDIHEKVTISAAEPPHPLTPNRTNSGFPVHRKRAGLSRFKQAAGAKAVQGYQDSQTSTTPLPLAKAQYGDESFEARQRREIDAENRARLARMSHTDIERERRELLENLDPLLVQRLMSMANIDQEPQQQDFPGLAGDDPFTFASPPQDLAPAQYKRPKRIASAKVGEEDYMPGVLHSTDNHRYERDVLAESESVLPSSTLTEPPTSNALPALHFPRPPVAPDLDPNSATFLEDLHAKYFPDLEADASKLAWMSDPSASPDQTYSPASSDLPVASLRFSFAGALLAPGVSAQIPTVQGLHHHGDAPTAAGYTVAELAHLARSSFPSQRCIAFQTTGRFLYRLGKGEFATGPEGDTVDRGLWACVKQGRLLETLQNEANKTGGHISAKSYAVDALWLWR